jgi:hypothetical protein
MHIHGMPCVKVEKGFQNVKGNVESLSSKLTYGKGQIRWRRGKVLELSSQDYNQTEISKILQISHGTVSSGGIPALSNGNESSVKV